jgi:hypothetical protein
MERTQISLTAEQARRLRQMARRRGTSMAALIRQAVDRTYGDDDETKAAWGRAMASVGGYRSDRPDVAQNHDAYLDEAYAE